MTAHGVLVVGSVTADLTATSQRLPARGETVLGDGFQLVAGGKGGNQALAAARMGTPTWIVGRVGEDQFAEVVRTAMTDAGVHTDHLRSTPGARTGIAHIRVDAGGENDIVMVPLANGELLPADVDAAVDALADRVRVVLSQLEIPVATAAHALRRGREAGLVTLLDPAPAADLPGELYPLVDVMTPNESEASRLTGIPVHDVDSAAAAAGVLLERGCRAVLVTLGAAGSLLAVTGREPRLIAAPRVDAVDTTAAGDAFAGALGSRLAAGDTLTGAVVWASAAGALTTTALGASSAIPDLDQVRALVEVSRTEERES